MTDDWRTKDVKVKIGLQFLFHSQFWFSDLASCFDMNINVSFLIMINTLPGVVTPDSRPRSESQLSDKSDKSNNNLLPRHIWLRHHLWRPRAINLNRFSSDMIGECSGEKLELNYRRWVVLVLWISDNLESNFQYFIISFIDWFKTK